MSTDAESRDNYGPYLPGVGSINPATGKVIPYNDVSAVREAFESHGDKIAGFLVEPIQGEAGIVVPSDNYLTEIRALCDKHNVLLICDEIQTGIARTGKLLCHEWAGIKPDMVLLGKAISGGMYPVSCVLGRKDVMLTIEPGTHGSTYGGNPLGCAVAIRALEVVREEKMVERAEKLGQIFRDGLRDLNSPLIATIRGKGLLNAIVIDESKTNGHRAWDLCMLMKEKGLLVSQGTNSTTIGLLTIYRLSLPTRTSSASHHPWSSPPRRFNVPWLSLAKPPPSCRLSRARRRMRLFHQRRKMSPSRWIIEDGCQRM